MLVDFSLLFYTNVRFSSCSADKKIPSHLSRPKFLLGAWGGATTSWDPFVSEGTNLLGNEKSDFSAVCFILKFVR